MVPTGVDRIGLCLFAADDGPILNAWWSVGLR